MCCSAMAKALGVTVEELLGQEKRQRALSPWRSKCAKFLKRFPSCRAASKQNIVRLSTAIGGASKTEAA